MIELLSVIAIIGVLAGLLVQAVLRGRFKARVITCTSNYRQLALAAVMSRYFTHIQGSKYAFLDLNWWVPRRLEGDPTVTIPDASMNPTRLETPWPAKLDDASVATRPIVSDWMVGKKSPSGVGFMNASGAHAYGGKIRNCNSGYADGHVETRPAGDIRWELQLTQREDAYIFY